VSAIKKIIQNESLADKAYQILKEEILNGRFQDKEALPEERLAKNLGISRTPLRDALAQLASEGLIIQQKGSPAKVAGFTRERSLEYMELRNLLEVYNIEKSIAKMDEVFFEKLDENVREQKTAIQQGTYHDFIEKDREFHLLLASVNQNKELQQLIHRINTGVNRAFIILSKTVPQSAEPAYEEHADIVSALKEKDVILAKNKMIVHMNNVEKRFLDGEEKG